MKENTQHTKQSVQKKWVFERVRVIPLPFFLPMLILPFLSGIYIHIVHIAILVLTITWVLLNKNKLKAYPVKEYWQRVKKGWTELYSKSKADSRLKNLINASGIIIGILLFIAPTLGLCALLIATHIVLAAPDPKYMSDSPIHNEER